MERIAHPDEMKELEEIFEKKLERRKKRKLDNWIEDYTIWVIESYPR